jgi:hypothetical protein
VQLATQLVASLTVSEQVGIVTGQGQFSAPCIGNTHGVNRSLPNAPNGVPSLCLNDGPAGVRAVDWVTGFPTGINAASTYVSTLLSLCLLSKFHNYSIILASADVSSMLVEKQWLKSFVERE